jgi:hypothetical protein
MPKRVNSQHKNYTLYTKKIYFQRRGIASNVLHLYESFHHKSSKLDSVAGQDLKNQ